MVGAVVQVLVAKHATPSFFAQTLPRFLAIAVHATRIYLTLVTSGSRPARVTSAKEKRKKHEFLAIVVVFDAGCEGTNRSLVDYRRGRWWWWLDEGS